MKDAPEILVVDDNPADVGLIRESLAETMHQTRVHAVGNVEEAIVYIQQQGRFRATARPDLVILDLNLIHRNGHKLLLTMKANVELRRIPVVVFSSSGSNADIKRSYELGANCYLGKPADLKRFFSTVRAIEEFWFGYVSLPEKEKAKALEHAVVEH